MNETYTIRVGSPLLRPGLTIETTVSKKYVEDVTEELLMMVREINARMPLKSKKEELEDMMRKDFNQLYGRKLVGR